MDLLIPEEVKDNLAHNLGAVGLKGSRHKGLMDKNVWFINNLIREKDRKGHSLGEFTGLNKSVLETFLGSRDLLEVKKQLLELEVLKANERYSTRGHFSKSYGLNPALFEGNIVEHRISAPGLLKRAKTSKQEITDPFLETVYHSVCGYGIDYNVYQFLTDLHRGKELKPMQYMAYYIRAKEIDFKDLYVIKDTTGRIYTNYTNLPKIMRPFISVGGQPLGVSEVDVSACMALILGVIMERKGLEAPEVTQFIKLSQEPEFYANLASIVGSSSPNFKKEFLVMLNEENEAKIKRPAWRLFKKKFPAVASFINETNKKDNGTLYRECATLESKIMINGVYKRLLAYRVPAFSIHDGILTTPENTELVASLIKKGFKEEAGRVPIIKVK